MEVRTLRDRVLVKLDPPRRLSSTIVGLEKWEDYPDTGTVVAVGDEVLDLEPGARVMLNVRTSAHTRLALPDGPYIEGRPLARTKSDGDLVIGVIEQDEDELCNGA